MVAQDAEFPGERFINSARHGVLGTKEVVATMPSKPRAVELGMGHLDSACSNISRGSRKPKENILVALGALLSEMLFSKPATMFT